MQDFYLLCSVFLQPTACVEGLLSVPLAISALAVSLAGRRVLVPILVGCLAWSGRHDSCACACRAVCLRATPATRAQI